MLDPQFVARVREHVVLQPITAVRTYVGVEIRDGKRRTLAANGYPLSAIEQVLTGEREAGTAYDEWAHDR